MTQTDIFLSKFKVISGVKLMLKKWKIHSALTPLTNTPTQSTLWL